jgi:D-alanyl-D-alanine dipeptidase
MVCTKFIVIHSTVLALTYAHRASSKSGQRLIHNVLIPNYAVKSLVHQWCNENNVTVNEPTTNNSSSRGTRTRMIFLVGNRQLLQSICKHN